MQIHQPHFKSITPVLYGLALDEVCFEAKSNLYWQYFYVRLPVACTISREKAERLYLSRIRSIIHRDFESAINAVTAIDKREFT